MRIAHLLVLTALISACSGASLDSGVPGAGEQPVAESAPPESTLPESISPEPLSGPVDNPGGEAVDSAALDAPAGPVVRADDVEAEAARLLASYLEATDQATASGGVETEAMSALVTPEWMATEQRGFADYRERQIRTLGRTGFMDMAIQSVRWTVEGMLEVAVFSCIDARNVWVLAQDSPEPPDDLVEWLERGTPAQEPTDDQVSAWQEFIDLVEPDAGVIEPVVVWMLGPGPESLRIDATDTWRGYHPCESDDIGD